MVTLFPSVLAELAVIRDKDRGPAAAGAASGTAGVDRAAHRQEHFGTAALRLGRWLTAGYRLADG